MPEEKYNYYVVFAWPGGLGSCSISMSDTIETPEHIDAVRQTVADGKALPVEHVVVLDWKRLQ